MATIKEVARLAGVGLGTASRVISGKGSVSAETAKRVRKAIADLDFRPSHAARALLSGSSQMVGVYFPLLEGTLLMPIMQAIDSELRAAGLHMVVAFGLGKGGMREQALEGIDFLIGRGCDGLIVMSDALFDSDIESLGPIKSRLVVLNHFYESIPEQCFTVDHFEGGRLAAQALLQQNHRKIALITGPSSATDNVERIDGFMHELKNAGIDTKTLWVADGDFSQEGGWAATETLVASGHEFTALFCANDLMAFGALSFFHHAGIVVPDQVSVIGYDDTSIAEFSAPRLTTVHISWREMTVNGLNHLLNLCYDLKRPIERKFKVGVNWRYSVSRIKSTPLVKGKAGKVKG